jgi:O-antigen/teichoic acid export membrane protein
MGFLFYYLNPSIGLILAYAISQLFVGLLVYYFNFKSIFQRTLEEIKKCFLVNIRNSFYNSLIILIQYSTPFAPILIGKYLYQSNDVGAFFLLSSAICAPFAIFRRSLLNLFNGEMTSPNKAKILIGKTKDKVLILFGIIFFLLLGVVIICFFAKEIVFFIFGEQWVSYSNFILPIFVFFYLDMIFQPFTTLLTLWGRQNYSMFLESIRFGLVYLLLPFLAYFLGFTYINLLIAYFFFSTCIYILNIVKVYSYITSLVNTN